MKVLARLAMVSFCGLIVASMAGTMVALAAKRRIVPHEDPEADDVTVAAIFEPLTFRSRARSFRGGSVDCWYGGGVVDLRDAILDPEGARLRVRAIFGGGQILVPESWRVTSKVRGIGGLGDTRARDVRPADAPQLTIEGTVLFGGFAVMSELPAEQARWLAETEARAEAQIEPDVQAEPEAEPEAQPEGELQPAAAN